MLETYMLETGAAEQWITVHELRSRFGLTRYQCNTVSAFLRRLNFGPFGCFPFIVTRMVRENGEKPSDPKKLRYLLRRRNTVVPSRGSTGAALAEDR